MNSKRPPLPPWLLSMEMLLCFVPLTFFTVVLVVASINRAMPIPAALLNLSATAVGPIGLLVAFRMIILKQTKIRRFVSVLLCLLAGWTLLAFALLGAGGSNSISEWWREFVLIALLPAMGCVHLVLMSSYSTKSSVSN
jgi:uncharacterized membrane protein YsdA (DUF1294 family)